MNIRKKEKQVINDIIALLLTKKLVHYSDIQEYTGLSKRTVAKYLNDVEVYLNSKNLSLIRKRNKGIYIEGDLKRLKHTTSLTENVVNTDITARILSMLIQTNNAISLDDLADKLFISKSTLIRKIEYLKNNYNLEIYSSKKGISVDPNSNITKDALTKYVQNHLKSKAYVIQNKMRYKYTFTKNMPTLFPEEIFTRISNVIENFVHLTGLLIERRMYELLIIHTAIEIALFKQYNQYPKNNMFDEYSSDNLSIFIYLISSEFNLSITTDALEYTNHDLIFIENKNLKRDITINKIVINKGNLKKILEKVIPRYDDILIKNLTNHLYELITRYKLNVYMDNPYKDEIKRKYPVAFDNALALSKNLGELLSISITESEVGFITLHFEAFIHRQVNLTSSKIRILIICSSGYGSSVLLKQEIEQKYSDRIEIVKTISEDEFVKNQQLNFDLIISTIEIENVNTNIIKVSPLLSKSDELFLEKEFDRIKREQYGNNVFLRLIKKDNIIMANEDNLTPSDVITKIVDNLQNNNYVRKGMLEASLNREKLSSTGLRNVAIPHGNPTFVNVPTISVFINKKSIKWGENRVHIAFYMALNDQVEVEIDKLYKYFYSLIRNDKKISELVNSKDPDDFMEKLLLLQ
ncbi:BglG family transcription antiterminator [Ligilactobacillus equi]|uniref:Transcription regulator, mannitol operon n=1 Tax=Ligilactobacillus equi DSM 15833 = JCM 10991 TaxID=1423740 RepID=A0A0R1TCP6_9LACO|nr:PTS sugar transporter subunit IIA [Ligilactobacillus equi]KRL76245.1 transcription regulator, mannitol operon [Ligilactobacillus equi DSM 15833 = JCM 10991]